MFAINSRYDDNALSIPRKVRTRLKLHRETLLYKISCIGYLLVIILLLTFFIVRHFKSKYRLDSNDCVATNWIDIAVTVLTLFAVLLGSILLIASLKYVSDSETLSRLPPVVAEPTVVVDKIEDFIRRNSQQLTSSSPVAGVSFARNLSVTSGSWLSTVRTEAYETHRRMSMVPTSSSSSPSSSPKITANSKRISEENTKKATTSLLPP